MAEVDVDIVLSDELPNGESSSVAAPLPTTVPFNSFSIVPQREPLKFEFRGYSIWLEINGCEIGGDYHSCILDCANIFGVQPIVGHVTAIYGMNHLSEIDFIHRFVNVVKPIFVKRGGWPSLKPVGLLSDVEINGVNGGEMDMAWSEVTMATSEDHEICLDLLYDIFFEANKVRKSPWKPHASLVYDNHIDSPLNLLDTIRAVSRYPTLTAEPKKITAMSLWKTSGRISKWEQIERFEFSSI